MEVTICDLQKRQNGFAYNPMAFTEQGVAMLSSVLNSERAILVNIVFEAITQLLEVDEKPKKKIGYLKEGQAKYGKGRRKK